MTKSAITNKQLAYDIARACNIPINEARKILFVFLDALVKDIRKNKILAIRDFGRFRLFKKKRVHIPSGFVAPTAYECKFQPRGKLARILKNRFWHSYAHTLANKYARQIKEGDIKGARKTKRMLKAYLVGKWSMARWLDDRGRLPYPLWKKRADDV